jgi:hypothetical protein
MTPPSKLEASEAETARTARLAAFQEITTDPTIHGSKLRNMTLQYKNVPNGVSKWWIDPDVWTCIVDEFTARPAVNPWLSYEVVRHSMELFGMSLPRQSLVLARKFSPGKAREKSAPAQRRKQVKYAVSLCVICGVCRSSAEVHIGKCICTAVYVNMYSEYVYIGARVYVYVEVFGA